MVAKEIVDLYRRERGKGCIVGEDAKSALRAARIRARWAELESEGIVRIYTTPDDDFVPDEGNCCCDDPDCSSKTGPAYGQIGEFRTDPDGEWQRGESIWGLTGYDDVDDNSYTVDIMGETLDAYDAAYGADTGAGSSG